jgi:hypothetical protein
VQAWFNFFGRLHHLGPDLNQRVLKVKRTGSRRERMFQFEGAGEALPLDVPFFDLGEFLEKLQASSMAALLGFESEPRIRLLGGRDSYIANDRHGHSSSSP